MSARQLDTQTLFREVTKLSRIRGKLMKGIGSIFCRIIRGRMGWDSYKLTMEIREMNTELFVRADYLVSDQEMAAFLIRQNVRI
jgi:hypothetical protein